MKILIVEDEITQRLRLEKILESFGYESVPCDNGTEAWEVIQQKDAPDLLVLDWEMPGMNGVDLCRKIRKMKKELSPYILLLTSKTKKEDIIKGIESGADDFISKPFNRQELEVRLRAGTRVLETGKKLIDARRTLSKVFGSERDPTRLINIGKKDIFFYGALILIIGIIIGFSLRPFI